MTERFPWLTESFLRWNRNGAALTLLMTFLCRGCAPSDEGEQPRIAAENAALVGVLKRYVVDYENGDHRIGHALETSEHEHVELRLRQPTTFHDGDVVRITGTEIERVFEPGARDRVTAGPLFDVEQMELVSKAVGRVDQAVVDGVTQTVRVAVVLLNFQGVRAQGFTQDDARARLATVRSYYQELSYGMWNVESEVFGPYEVPRPNDCNLDTITNAARAAAPVSGFDHVAVTLPSNDDSGLDCACGLAWLGRTPAQQNPEVQGGSLYTCTDPNAFAHELGHGFGLHHASTADCDGVPMKRNVHDACAIAEYGNQFNTMGNGLGHMNAFQKSAMKWFDRCNTVRVTKDAEFDVLPAQIESEGVQALQIANGDTRDGNPLFYYVEFRNPALANFNAGDGQPREKGIGVHIDVAPDFRVSNGDMRPILLDLTPGSSGDFSDPRLGSGTSFQDPDGRVTIDVLDATSERARVRVTFPGGGTGANLCSDGSSPGDGGEGEGAGAGATLFQHCDYGGWAVSLAPGEYDAAMLATLGVADNDASSLQVREGYEVVMFDGPDFTGNSVTLTAASACFVGQTFNDVLSSLRIRKLGGDQDPDAGAPAGDGSDASDGDGATGEGDGATGEGDGSTSEGDGDAADGAPDMPPTTDDPAGGCSVTSGNPAMGAFTFAGVLATALARRRRIQRRKTSV